MNKIYRILAAVGLGLALAATPVLANVNGPDAKPSHEQRDHKVNICHATNSDSNPYVLIRVDKNSAKYKGHLMHRNYPNKIWKSAGTFRGATHIYGTPKPDLIEGLDGVISSGEVEKCQNVPTPTPTPSATSTPTPSATSSGTPTPSVTPSPTPTATSVPTPSPSQTPTPTSSGTPQPSLSPSVNPTLPPTDTETQDTINAVADGVIKVLAAYFVIALLFMVVVGFVLWRFVKRLG